MTKATISKVKEALELQQGKYKDLTKNLQMEKHLAMAEQEAARQSLEPVLAGFVARLVPDLNAPALTTLDKLIAAQGHPRTPTLIHLQRKRQNIEAAAELANLTREYGPLDSLKEQHKQNATQRAETERTCNAENRNLATANTTLNALDRLNDRLLDKGYVAVSPGTLDTYARPAGRLAKITRWATDSAYRMARPVLDLYAKNGIDLVGELEARTARQERLDELTNRKSQLNTAYTVTEQRISAQEEQMALQRSPKEILSEVRTVITSALLDRKTFIAARAAFLTEMPAEAEALSLRAELFGKLADNILVQHNEAAGVSEQLEDPLDKLSKAARKGKGSKQIEFDLAAKTASMARHQTLLGQRLNAARDIRTRSHDTSAAYPNSSTDMNNYLLWYLIFSDTGPTQTAAPAFHGGGGNSGGGGASGNWDDRQAENSYFRAEMLGVTPSNAKVFGLDASLLKVAPETLSDLGVSGSDFKGADFSSAALPETSSSIFNGLGGGLNFDTGKLDLGNTISDVKSGISDIISNIGHTSSYGGDSGGWSCGGGGGGDGGGGGGGDGGGGGGGD